MIYPVETFPVSFSAGIEGVYSTWYRKGNLMTVDTFKDIKLSEAFDVSALPEPMPSGYKGKELSRHITISTIGDLQSIRLTRVLEIEGWSSSVELEPVEVNETEELRQLVKEEVKNKFDTYEDKVYHLSRRVEELEYLLKMANDRDFIGEVNEDKG